MSGVNKRIWASLDDYLPPGDGFQYVGRNIANHTFFRALLTYGHFDEYHFFLANSAHCRAFEAMHGPLMEETGVKHRVKLFDRMGLPDQLKQCDYTVFHQSDHVTFFNALCHLRNRMGSFPVTAFIHSLSYQRFMSKYLEMAMGGVTSGDAIVCSSVAGQQVVENCFRQISEKLAIQPPPVQLTDIPLGFDGAAIADMDPLACRKQLGLDEREVIGLCFGRFSDYDKMDLFPLLQAFQMIYERGRPWRLILAGGVHSRDYVRILELWARVLGISRNVTIMTNLPEGDKQALYRAADFFVSPSDNPQETFGITLLEAMASGLPVLVSDFDGYREIATQDVGIRIKTTWDSFEPLTALGPLMDESTYHRYLAQSICIDVVEMSDALRTFYADPELCRRMGEAARERFLKLYDYRVVVARLEALWSSLKEAYTRKPDSNHTDPLAMDYQACFPHYATDRLTPETRIASTNYAQGLASSGMEYPLLPDMDRLIDRQEAQTIIGQTDNALPVSSLLGGDAHGRWDRRYLIMWMLKHGMLKISDPADRAAAVRGDDRAPVLQPSPARPRILYILHNYHSHGGTEHHTKDLAAGLKDQYDVRIIFPGKDHICMVGPDEDTASLPADPPSWPITPYSAPQTASSLDLLVQRFDPDVIHVQHFMNWPLCVIDRLIQTGKPVVVSFHDYYPITPQFTMQGVKGALQTLSGEYATTIFGSDITPYLEKRREVISRSLGESSVLVCPSPFLARELGKVFPFDFQIIEHGITPFEPQPRARPSSNLCFGYVGSLIPQKGWDLLSQAFAPVRAKHPASELHFYGGGRSVSANGLKGIHFHGEYQPQDLSRILSQIDIGIIPSIFKETFCLTLSEMWLARLPVAVSDIGALGDRVTNGENGLKFVPGSLDAMTDKLIWFLENDQWRSWSIPKPRLLDEMLDDYDGLYRSLV